MTALALSLLGQFWPVLVLAGVAIVSFLKGQSRGAKLERAKRDAADQRVRDIADEIQNDVRAMSPEQIDAELRKRARG